MQQVRRHLARASLRQVHPALARRDGPSVRVAALSARRSCRRVRQVRRHLVRGSLRQVRPALAHRDGLSVREAALLVCPRPAAWQVSRRGAAARPCFRQAEARSEQPLAVVSATVVSARVLSGPAWSWAPAVARRQPVEAAVAQARASPSEMKVAAVGAEAAQPVASARQGLLPAEEEVAASGAKARPRAAAEVLPAPSVRQPGVAGEAESAVPVQPPGAAVAGPGVVLPQEAEVAARLDVAVGRLPEEAAVALPDVAALQPAAEARRARAPSVLPPAVAHPSAAAGLPVGLPWPCHRPWLAPRQAERTAHAMRRPRTASPSRQLWRAAKCGAWS